MATSAKATNVEHLEDAGLDELVLELAISPTHEDNADVTEPSAVAAVEVMLPVHATETPAFAASTDTEIPVAV